MCVISCACGSQPFRHERRSHSRQLLPQSSPRPLSPPLRPLFGPGNADVAARANAATQTPSGDWVKIDSGTAPNGNSWELWGDDVNWYYVEFNPNPNGDIVKARSGSHSKSTTAALAAALAEARGILWDAQNGGGQAFFQIKDDAATALANNSAEEAGGGFLGWGGWPWNWFGKDAEANANEWQEILNEETNFLQFANKILGSKYTKVADFSPEHRAHLDGVFRKLGTKIDWEGFPSSEENIQAAALELQLLNIGIGAARVVEGIDIAISIADGAFLVKQGGKWFLKKAGQEGLERISKSKVDDLLRLAAKEIDGQVHHMIPHLGKKGRRFKDLLSEHGVSPELLDDAINKLPLPKHSGSHIDEYHDLVYDQLEEALSGKSGNEAKDALSAVLLKLREKLIRDPRMPFSDGGLR